MAGDFQRYEQLVDIVSDQHVGKFRMNYRAGDSKARKFSPDAKRGDPVWFDVGHGARITGIVKDWVDGNYAMIEVDAPDLEFSQASRIMKVPCFSAKPRPKDTPEERQLQIFKNNGKVI